MKTLSRVLAGLVVCVFLLCASFLAQPSASAHAPQAVPLACPPLQVTHIRSMQAWYGSVFNGATTITSTLQLSDHVTSLLAAKMGTYSDSRVTSNVGVWVISGQTNVEWIFASPENLPAETNLRNALATVGPVCFDSPINRGTIDYTLAQWQTFESAECGMQVVDRTGIARVSYYELNAQNHFCLFLPLVRRD